MRSIECVNTITGKLVSTVLCKAKNQPKHLEVCVAPMCVTWHAGEWKECSAECGKVHHMLYLYRNIYTASN